MKDMLNTYALNWLSSGTGQGFVNNLKTGIENSASLGKSNITIDFVSLGINEVRWGLNEAFKVKIDENPIGVIPFKTALINEIMIFLGFKINKPDESVFKNRIDVSW